jgi:hypothetical protein
MKVCPQYILPMCTGKTENHWSGLTAGIVWLSALLLLFNIVTSFPVKAHESIGSVSNVILTVQGRTAEYYLNIPPVLGKLLDDMGYGNEEALEEYFTWTLKMTSWDAPCELHKLRAIAPQASGNRIIHLEYICPREITDLTINSTTFLDIDEKHIQFIKLAPPDNPRNVLQEGMLTLKRPVFHIADVKTGGSVLLYRAYRFFILGMEHILSGYDHILFILSAILVVSAFLETLKLVTAFTVAHSITLALAFLGIVSLSASIVEPLIALTIAVVAFENVFMENFKRRWMLIFGFGLVHGLGFVGVLKEITVTKQELLTSLFSFNVGIEAGQILIVTTGLLFMYFLHKASWAPVFVRWSSISIGVLGLIWFFERIYNTDLMLLVKG